MANDINRVILVGRVVRDLDEKSFGYVGNGLARANISIAVNRGRKQGDQWIEEVSYFDVTIWGKTAENLKPYLSKGKQICVEGFLKQDRWDDQSSGQKRSRVTIVADQVQLLGGKSEGSQNFGGAPSFQPQQGFTSGNNFTQNGFQQNSFQQSNFAQDSFGATASDFPEDIPF